MDFIRILLPADLAGELVNDHVAVRPYETRGAADEVIRMAVNDVNTAASVVTVAMAADAVRKFAARLWARLRRSEEEALTVTVTVPGQSEPRELKVRRDDSEGADKVLDFLIEVLPTSHG